MSQVKHSNTCGTEIGNVFSGVSSLVRCSCARDACFCSGAEQQIPFGNDNQKGKGNNKSNSKGKSKSNGKGVSGRICADF